MAEKLTLTAAITEPIPNRPGLVAATTDLLPYRLVLELGVVRDGSGNPTGYADEGSSVMLTVAGAQGVDRTVETATGATARTKINALNKANLSTKSLLRRAIEELEAFEAQYDGTFTGTPD